MPVTSSKEQHLRWTFPILGGRKHTECTPGKLHVPFDELQHNMHHKPKGIEPPHRWSSAFGTHSIKDWRRCHEIFHRQIPPPSLPSIGYL